MTELISYQERGYEAMKQFGMNYKKDGSWRKTVSYLNKRIEILKGYWFNFDGRDKQLRARLSGNQLILLENIYAKAKNLYQNLLSDMTTRKSLLTFHQPVKVKVTDPKVYVEKFEWLRTKLERIWKSKRFCGLCLEESNDLHPLSSEIIVNKEKSTIAFVDLLNYVFNDDVENMVATKEICKSCIEQALKAYLFMYNTRQLSRVMRECVEKLHTKVLDITALLGDKGDCTNANVMLDIEVKPELFSLVESSVNPEFKISKIPKLLSNKIHSSTIAEMHKKLHVTPRARNSKNKKKLNVPAANSDQNNQTETEDIIIIKFEEDGNEALDVSYGSLQSNKGNQKTETQFANLDFGSASKNDNVRMKPEIYLKGGNIVIEPMITSAASSAVADKYMCSSCTKEFKSEDRLLRHEIRHKNESVYQCNICKISYKSLELLNVHLKIHATVTCKLCEMELPPGDLMQHLRAEHVAGVHVHPCQHCPFVYYSREDLHTHIKLLHTQMVKEESESSCLMCLKDMPHTELKMHRCKFQCSECSVMPCIHHRYLLSYREQVLSYVADVKCVDCDYVAKQKKYLIIHANRDHLDHHPFTCNDCGTEFYSKMSLRIHLQQSHKILNICPFCDEEFNKLAFYEHKRMCKSFDRPFSCDTCLASFFTSKKLANHKSLRHTDFGYPCSMCDKRFLGTAQLEEHQVAVHYRQQNLKFRKGMVCTVCDMEFRNFKDLRAHGSMHGPNVQFPCKMCSNEFFSLRKLNDHMQQHFDSVKCGGCKKRVVAEFYPHHEIYCPYKKNSTTPYVCEACGKSFHLKALLLFHKRFHIDPVPCPECLKICKPFGLKKHLMKAHSDKSNVKDKCKEIPDEQII